MLSQGAVHRLTNVLSSPSECCSAGAALTTERKAETDNKEIINVPVLHIKLRANYCTVITHHANYEHTVSHPVLISHRSSYPRAAVFILLIICSQHIA